MDSVGGAGAASDDEVDESEERLGRVRSVRGFAFGCGCGCACGGAWEVLIVRLGTCPPAPAPVLVPVLVLARVLDSRRGATRVGGTTIG
jgi:hypothetical protein